VRDSPGFATSRLGVALGLEAIRMLEEGVARAADIDSGMVLGYRHPMGPLRLTDLVGLDVRLAIAEHLSATLGPASTRPPCCVTRWPPGSSGRRPAGVSTTGELRGRRIEIYVVDFAESRPLPPPCQRRRQRYLGWSKVRGPSGERFVGRAGRVG